MSNSTSSQNKHIVSAIDDAVKFCGMQSLPMQGHRESMISNPSGNRGNFLAMLDYIVKYDPILQDHIQLGKKNQQYTSKVIQNEIVSIIAPLLREKLLSPLKTSKYYSVMADEVTHKHVNQEILSLCIRFVDFS